MTRKSTSIFALVSASILLLGAMQMADARGGGGGGRGGGGGFAGGGFGGGRGGGFDSGGGYGRGYGDSDYGRVAPGGGYGNEAGAEWREGNDGGYGPPGARWLDAGAGWRDAGAGWRNAGAGWRDAGAGWRNAGGEWREPPSAAGGNWGTAGGANATAAAGLGSGVKTYGSVSGKAASSGFGFDHGVNANAFGVNANAFSRYSPAQLADRGGYVRDNFNRYDNFWGRDWWNRYPGAWWPGGWGWGDAWGLADWGGFGGYIGYDDSSEPDYYDYGGSITYNNNNVYYNTTPVATVTDYYTQAQTLAASGNNSTKGQQWKPLGVYALVQGSQSDTNAMFQLAMDKNGDVGGNYHSVLTGQTLPVKGKLDKKNQRVAWTVGTNKDVVYDTGLGNLFSNQAPILVHLSKTKTEQWLLVRLQRPTSGTASGTTGTAGATSAAGE